MTGRWSPLAEPVVVSGDNVGFRIEWMNGTIPTGQLMVRVKGLWVEARVGKPPNVTVIPEAPDAPPRPR